MEKNKLNLNAPIISARRYSSPIRSSERPSSTKTEKSLPHRQHSLPVHNSDWELSEVAERGTVPFQWEKIPGKSKEDTESKSQTNTPRLPPRIERSPLNISGNLLEMMKKGPYTEGEKHSESEDDQFSDALDILSLSESRSMSCSISGLSGYCGSDVKSQGSFCADVQTRDFMMNRFLPAAKAMILKTPQYASKKQMVAPEQPKQLVNKMVSTRTQRRPHIEQDKSHIEPNSGEYKEDTESEIGEDEINIFGKTPVKSFGFFSRFCLKNSMCLLNPVPAMKARTQSRSTTLKKSSTKKTPAKEVSRLVRKAYSGPLTQITDKLNGGVSTKQKSDGGSRSQELYKVKNKPSGESPRLSYSGELRMTRSSSPYRAYTRGGLSPYRSETPSSPFGKGTSFIGVTKDGENVKVVKSPIIPKIEKTVYIDHVSSVKRTISESISPADSNKEEINLAETVVKNMKGLDVFYAENRSSEKIEMKNDLSLKADAGNGADVMALSSLPPPLPKSPSESWLWRTLPSISLGRPFSSPRAHFHSKNQQAKASNTGAKWETIVKSSNVHHDHMRYSEELVPHLSQHLKT